MTTTAAMDERSQNSAMSIKIAEPILVVPTDRRPVTPSLKVNNNNTDNNHHHRQKHPQQQK